MIALLDHLHHATDVIRLDYDARLVRRKRLMTEGGRAVMLDLPELTDLSRIAGLRLEDGTEIALEAAAEPVLVIRGDLPRLAWHIGNRHTPCQIDGDTLVIRADHVLRGMLEGLKAEVTEDVRPFHPEGGAYGHGRTMGHDHGHDG
ncbi:urease accessory protein UreE [Jannaschia pohangensis]|uniref:Urease accessory protein UreE n=1 Tax=Jannaschia pohangensis TaxID=390807 RepID=A0A1I3HLN3_9RHOB|nr:urease accessory protein UreE [Jannaschia pohangensis]SFI36591.1 urease accessory protein [Jannaschia pohangensis]